MLVLRAGLKSSYGSLFLIGVFMVTRALTVTFHHPEQSLLHKLHWLDHVIRVGVFSVNCFMLLGARMTYLTLNTITLIITHPL